MSVYSIGLGVFCIGIGFVLYAIIKFGLIEVVQNYRAKEQAKGFNVEKEVERLKNLPKKQPENP